jgi:hypothetical protein
MYTIQCQGVTVEGSSHEEVFKYIWEHHREDIFKRFSGCWWLVEDEDGDLMAVEPEGAIYNLNPAKPRDPDEDDSIPIKLYCAYMKDRSIRIPLNRMDYDGFMLFMAALLVTNHDYGAPYMSIKEVNS